LGIEEKPPNEITFPFFLESLFSNGGSHMETGRQTKEFPFGDSPFPNGFVTI
jgi:hypothetical protein